MISPGILPKCKIGKRDGHGQSRNGHGKVIEKYFVKSVGTLQGERVYFCDFQNNIFDL